MADRTGQQLGNYRVIRPIGRGGFAEVYLGEHIYLKTQVAIKILQTKVANDEDLEGFLKEAQTIAHLVHPQIIRVMDFGVDGETPFLVMDYAPNGTLRQRHPKGTPLPLTTITPYVKQIATGLQYAHDQKLIHRDIKPENMLVGRNHDVLLSDFGIALVAQSSRYQSTQDVVGTVAYMSPEQIQGKPRPASDQYSLGIVVYEWLSGVRPFHGSFTELCTQHMFATPPPLREKVPTVPHDVEQVVTSALAKDPKQRFMNVQAFANALEQASQSQLSTFLAPRPYPQYSSSLPPTQAAMTPPAQQQPSIAPPFPPTQAARMSMPQGARPPSYSGYPNQAVPMAGSPAPKVKVWSIGKRQKVAMLVGASIFIVLWLISLLIFDFNFSVGHYPPSGILTIAGFIFLGLAFVMPPFFGSVFGPWVGPVTGVVGFLVGLIIFVVSHAIYLYDFTYTFPLYWPIPLGIALIGFISGFAMFKTKGRYNIRRSLGFGSLGIICGVVFAASGISISYAIRYSSSVYYNSNTIKSIIIQIYLTFGVLALIYIVIDLILLPILLVIYYKIIIRRKLV